VNFLADSRIGSRKSNFLLRVEKFAPVNQHASGTIPGKYALVLLFFAVTGFPVTSGGMYYTLSYNTVLRREKYFFPGLISGYHVPGCRNAIEMAVLYRAGW
jgi:hypothetical protein